VSGVRDDIEPEIAHSTTFSSASKTQQVVRAAIQASDDAGTALAERFGVTAQTIYKWRKRDSVEDRSHTPHRLQTTLTPAQEAVAVALRKTLLVSASAVSTGQQVALAGHEELAQTQARAV